MPLPIPCSTGTSIVLDTNGRANSWKTLSPYPTPSPCSTDALFLQRTRTTRTTQLAKRQKSTAYIAFCAICLGPKHSDLECFQSLQNGQTAVLMLPPIISAAFSTSFRPLSSRCTSLQPHLVSQFPTCQTCHSCSSNTNPILIERLYRHYATSSMTLQESPCCEIFL